MAKMATRRRRSAVGRWSLPPDRTTRRPNDREQYIDDALKSACRSQTLPQVGKQLRNRLIIRWTDPVMTIALTSGESALEHGDLAHVAKSCGACVGSLRPQNENAKVLTQLATARAMMRAGKTL
ncbi:MAG: hypothetical protein EOS26_05430 [Mesorhizobium sp.]|nr:MAG: hypothetical protein EOS26_05430 [Mesorhizobium sp.]